MNKPITLVVDDFRNGILDMINSTKIPLFIIEYVLNEVLQEVHIGSLKQLENDKQRYKQALLKETEGSCAKSSCQDAQNVVETGA